MNRTPLSFLGMVSIATVIVSVNVSAETAASTPTFNTDVAPILFENCVSCHRPDQIAPMVLITYQDVRPWARAIKDKVVKREMPPWHADPRFGTFRRDRRLTQVAIDTIAAWVDGGAPEGETPLTVELPVFEDGGWVHPSGRSPDLILSMEPFEVPAQGELPNFTIYQELPQELKEEERFLEAIQMAPGSLEAVHHFSFGIRPLRPGTKVGTGELWPGGPVFNGALLNAETGESVGFSGDTNEAAEDRNELRPRSESDSISFCCYVPGGGFLQYQPGVGKRVPTDGYISWGVHYTTVGRPVTDQSRVGLWFQDEIAHEIETYGAGGGQTHIVQGKQLVDDDFTPLRINGVGNAGAPAIPVIPPFTDDWAITEIRVFPNDVTVYLMWAHMHTRGQEMTYLVTYPDGREEVILSVPNFDFNWQQFYELEEPIKIPAGSTLKTIGSYDNSVANKWNPAPQKEVYWSEQSWDEMFNGFIDFTVDKRVLQSSKSATDGGAQ